MTRSIPPMPSVPRLYLDASIYSRLAEPAGNTKRRKAEALLRLSTTRFELISSPVVPWELGKTPESELRAVLLARLAAAAPKEVEHSARAGGMALELLRAGRWSEDHYADMLHLAYTILAEADALVTWDLKDLARDKTRRLVHRYTRSRGLLTPLIGTPEEVALWLGLSL